MKSLVILAMLTTVATVIALGGSYYVGNGKDPTSPEATITGSKFLQL